MNQQTIDSATSYSVGGVGLAVGALAEAANTAQAITIILACIVVAIRLVYDVVKLYRFLRDRR